MQSPIAMANSAIDSLNDKDITVSWRDATGKLVQDLKFDSVETTDYTSDAQVSTMPIEAGSFASYNKVRAPRRVQLRLLKTETLFEGAGGISLLISYLQQMLETPSLAFIKTPWEIYEGYSLTAFSYSRNAREGFAMLVADCTFEEVRQVQTSAQSEAIKAPKKAKDSATKQAGNTEAKPAESAAKTLKDKAVGLGQKIREAATALRDSLLGRPAG